MLTRRAILLALILLLAAVPSYASPADESDAGLKATEQSEEGRPNVPASNVWGMMLMVMLILTATTVGWVGGGLTPRRAHGFSESMHGKGIEYQPAEPEPSTKTVEARQTKRSRKRRSRPRLDPEQRNLVRKGWHLSRRQNNHGRPGGRRSGPGCRGIR